MVPARAVTRHAQSTQHGMLDGALEQEPEAVHERVEVAAHVVAAEEQGEEALDNGVEELKFDVASYADEEKWGDNFVQALAVGHAAALAVPASCDQQHLCKQEEQQHFHKHEQHRTRGHKHTE